MPIYDVYGNASADIYDINSSHLLQAYDVNGDQLIDEEPDITPMSWDMSEDYKTQVLDTLDYIVAYKQLHENSYAICQFNDVHTVFSGNEPNFIDYNNGYKVLAGMLFLGDMVNNTNSSQFANSVAYMQGAQASKRLVGMGNHEYFYYNSSSPNPETAYKAAINIPVTYMYENDDVLIYYYDDIEDNVRFILLDYFYITKTGSDSGHLLDTAQLEWLATVLENSADKDIIIGAHSMLNPFTALESGQTLSSSATLQNYQSLIDLINAFKDRDTFTVAVDGVSYEHDFSSCSGDFVMYTSGHYHALGYGDFGFNMFTCPTLGSTYGGSHKGFTFYVIDKDNKEIKVIQCSSQLTNYLFYEYTY